MFFLRIEVWDSLWNFLISQIKYLAIIHEHNEIVKNIYTYNYKI